MKEQLRLLEPVEAQCYDAVRDGLRVRESRRARRLILQLVPPHILELVVPQGTRARVVERFVRENRHWIERAWAELATRCRGSREALPQHIELRAIGSAVRVEYGGGAGRSRRGWRAGPGVLRIDCGAQDAVAARAVLRKWLLEQARVHLKPWLLRESVAMGARPAKVQVRLQRTRWGSCSSNGTISLNASLLLLEPALVRYLLVHELSHLHCLDHSARYWRHVARFVPDYRSLDRRLAEAWTEMPLWIAEVKR
jgi:predicted metal-dependent hydrolase